MTCAVALATVAGLVVLGEVTPASSAPAVSVVRAQGGDRYETARLVAATVFPRGSAHAVLARGDVFADALAGSRLAGVFGAPILLTSGDQLHPQAAAALAELGVTTVHLLGGASAISDGVRDQLIGAGYAVERTGGADRYQTAALVAQQGDAGSTPGAGRTAIVASGSNFPDALAGGPLAYRLGLPVLLTTQGSLPDATKNALRSGAIDHVILLGGPIAVSDAVAGSIRSLGISVERLAGADRYETAAAVASYASDVLGFPRTAQVLATGTDFPDALVAGPLAGQRGGVILLTDAGLPAPSAGGCAFGPAFSSMLIVGSATADVPYVATESCRILGQGNGAAGLAWVNDSTSALTAPSPTYRFNSAGGSILVAHPSTGEYSVRMAGIGRLDGTVQITSSASARYCTAGAWTTDGADLVVPVHCRDLFARAADAQFNVLFHQPSVGRAPLGLAYVADPVSSAALLDNRNYNSSGASNVVFRRDTGAYTVRFPGLVGVTTARVTAVGDGSTRCSVGPWRLLDVGTDDRASGDVFTDDRATGDVFTDVDVTCHTTNAAPADSAFSLVAGSAASLVPEGLVFAAHAWVDEPEATTTTLDADHHENPAGGPVTVWRSAAGAYTVTIPSAGSAAGHAQVVAYGDTPNHCFVFGWGAAGADELVHVRCEDKWGNQVDTPFVVHFVK